jgi:bifunctional non-homologous end joining protein LigD
VAPPWRARQLLSRNARDLAPWFPELVEAAWHLPPSTLLDGEIVICDENGLSGFGRLQERLSTARSGIWAAARARPAVLLMFDALEIAGTDLTGRALATRRRELEQLVEGLHPCLQLVAQTADASIAEDWLRLPGLEGVVASASIGPMCQVARAIG